MTHDLTFSPSEAIDPAPVEVKPPNNANHNANQEANHDAAHSRLIMDSPHPHCTWPPERFYWAVVEAPAHPGSPALRGKRLSQSLTYHLESVVPGIAAEDLHIVHAPVPVANGSNTGSIVCGIPRDTLRQALADPGNGRSPLTLCPSGLPAFIANQLTGDFDPSTLNLLTGDFTPPQVRTLRESRNVWTLCIAVMLAILLALGLHLRTQHLRTQITDLERREAQVLAEVLPPVSASAPSNQPAHLRLLAELRMLEQTRSHQDSHNLSPRDVSHDLAALLATWPPTSLHTQVESIVITDSAITIRGRVPTMADAQHWVDALQSVPGFTTKQPQTSTGSSGSIETTITLSPNPRSASTGTVNQPDAHPRGGS